MAHKVKLSQIKILRLLRNTSILRCLIRQTMFLMVLVPETYGQAQTDRSLPNANPMTPNAAALFKVLERPVGTFTGTVPINFPLYTVNSGTINVPINLSYSNGGIRVEEIAGWVGLGFSLSVGGQITRSVNGIADDCPGIGMFYAALKPSQFPGIGNYERVSNAKDAANEDLDTEPDMFYFSINGRSGKFFFDESKNPHLVSQEDLEIKPAFSGDGEINAWCIIDETGTKYFFGKYQNGSGDFCESSLIKYQNFATGQIRPSKRLAISTWRLTEIRDMNNEQVVRFSYKWNEISFSTLSGAWIRLDGQYGLICDGTNDSWSEESGVINNTSECLLTNIIGKNDSVIFYSSVNREDHGGGKLDSCIIYSKKSEVIKRLHFDYSYFSQPFAPATHLYKRLKLKSFSEFGIAANDSLKTTFEYEETVNLPARLSKAVDYWGYYNGQENNWTYLPNGLYQNSSVTYRRDDLADRRARPQFSVANCLKKITYPTGGYREFIYEGNKILSDSWNQMQPDPEYYINQNFVENTSSFQAPEIPVLSHNFTVNSKEGNSKFDFELNTSSWYGDVEIRFIRIINGYESVIMSFSGQYNGSYLINNGDYRLEIYRGNGSVVNGVTCQWKELHLSDAPVNYFGGNPTANNFNAGGIRTKEVIDFDPVSGIYNKTKYRYSLFSDSTLTSGVMPNLLHFAHQGNCDERACQYMRLSAQSSYPLVNEGSYVLYPQVTTFQEGNGRYEIVHNFIPDGDSYIGGSFYGVPVVPPLDRSILRGKIIEERWYNHNGDQIRQTHSSGLGWGFHGAVIDYMTKTQLGHKFILHDDGNTFGLTLCKSAYTLQSQFTGLMVTNKQTFNIGGQALNEITENFYYTNYYRPVLKEQRIHLSDGKTKVTSYRYAFNSPSEFIFGLTVNEQTIKDQLLAKHYIQPLEVTTTVSNGSGTPVLTDGSKYSFDIFNGNRLHLASYKSFGSPTNYKETVFSAYDTRGNLLEKSQQGGLREVYLWGYNGEYPVAKILGSDLTTVSSLVSPATLDNPIDENTLRTHLGALRSNFAGTNIQVSSYTYKPLVGMTSATDAKGHTIFYDYDKFMRLKAIKDHKQQLVKSYQYHYQTP